MYACGSCSILSADEEEGLTDDTPNLESRIHFDFYFIYVRCRCYLLSRILCLVSYRRSCLFRVVFVSWHPPASLPLDRICTSHAGCHIIAHPCPYRLRKMQHRLPIRSLFNPVQRGEQLASHGLQEMRKAADNPPGRTGMSAMR